MGEETRKLIKGVTLNLGGEDYVMPALNLEQCEEFAEDLDNLATTLPVKEQRVIVVKLALAALQRNYPEMTLTKVKQLIDLGNYLEVHGAILGINGFVPAGEPKPAE